MSNRKPVVAPRILVLEGLWADTTDIVTDAGGVGIEASPWRMEDVKKQLESGRIDGLLLTGGTDVNPEHYGQKACPYTQSPDYTRDEVELYALDWARRNKAPVLGICRGSQIMCVATKGTLTQDVQSMRPDTFLPHTSTTHFVFPAEKSTVFKRACPDMMKAMSLHHQCVDTPGPGMRIAAFAPDGTPEAIESKNGLMLGVQFHPEMSAYEDETAFGIFRWLVETAATRKGGRARAVTFREAVQDYKDRRSFAYFGYRDDAYPDSWEAWEDYYNGKGTSPGTTSSNPGGPRIEGRKYPSRKAGEPSLPSQRTPTTREMVNLIESSTGGGVIVTDAAGNVIDSTCEDDVDYVYWDGKQDCVVTDLGEPIDYETIDWNAVEWGGNYEERCPAPFDCDAAQRAYPTDTPRSTDEVVAAIEQELLICPTCLIKFDLIEDCDDHIKYIHPKPTTRDPMERLYRRFPEMYAEPPQGDPAWDDDQTMNAAAERAARDAAGVGDWDGEVTD